MKNDSEVQRSVQEELKWEPGVTNASKIGVAVKDGIVTLTGTVNSHFEKWAAERAAKRVFGVNALAVELEVKLPVFAKRTDTDIAKAAENALNWDATLPNDCVKVMVENGWVTLEGNVDWQYQRSSAEDDVRYLTGIRGVSNKIVLKPTVAPGEIKSKIEAAFKRSAILDAQHIKVKADGSKVTLSGSVSSWTEREEAEDAAWAAPGVTEVKNSITINYAAAATAAY
ncbi:MAG TPA: BON domain-containing protein [Methylococcaceae bacterium]|jgi:osmotically-inducible protein OsmY|nr:BON domain-containing protein [Methylococcaceae bacterium]